MNNEFWEKRKKEIKKLIYNNDFKTDEELCEEFISQEKEIVRKFAESIYNINPFNGVEQEGYAVIGFKELKIEVDNLLKQRGIK